jgi:dihydropteroate synthase
MFTLNCNGRLLAIKQPIVMGIINATPDSFYSASRQATAHAALAKAEQMLSEGAVILDIGGQSTRPGSAVVDVGEERNRVLPLLEVISKRFPEAFLSVDTYHHELAKAAVEYGAAIINDISGGLFDEHMLETVAALKVPYVCMHVKGTPATMHEAPHYEHFMQELLDHFIKRIDQCREAGIRDIIIDPGFGFSKTVAHNFELIGKLELLPILGKPLLLGVSRKSTIYKTLGISVDESLNGTTVLHTAGLLKGANILRVHDVKEAVQAIRLCSFLM